LIILYVNQEREERQARKGFQANLPSRREREKSDQAQALVQEVGLEEHNKESRQSREVLAKANNIQGEFYDWAPVGFLTLSEAGVIQEANLTAASQLQAPRKSLIGKPLRSFIKGADIERFTLYLQRVFQKPGTQPCEIRLKRPDGSDFYARLDSIAGQGAGESRICRTSITTSPC